MASIDSGHLYLPRSNPRPERELTFTSSQIDHEVDPSKGGSTSSQATGSSGVNSGDVLQSQFIKLRKPGLISPIVAEPGPECQTRRQQQHHAAASPSEGPTSTPPGPGSSRPSVSRVDAPQRINFASGCARGPKSATSRTAERPKSPHPSALSDSLHQPMPVAMDSASERSNSISSSSSGASTSTRSSSTSYCSSTTTSTSTSSKAEPTFATQPQKPWHEQPAKPASFSFRMVTRSKPDLRAAATAATSTSKPAGGPHGLRHSASLAVIAPNSTKGGNRTFHDASEAKMVSKVIAGLVSMLPDVLESGGGGGGSTQKSGSPAPEGKWIGRREMGSKGDVPCSRPKGGTLRFRVSMKEIGRQRAR